MNHPASSPSSNSPSSTPTTKSYTTEYKPDIWGLAVDAKCLAAFVEEAVCPYSISDDTPWSADARHGMSAVVRLIKESLEKIIRLEETGGKEVDA